MHRVCTGPQGTYHMHKLSSGLLILRGWPIGSGIIDAFRRVQDLLARALAATSGLDDGAPLFPSTMFFARRPSTSSTRGEPFHKGETAGAGKQTKPCGAARLRLEGAVHA